jgi:tRNA pseudouridine38-40 synthase
LKVTRPTPSQRDRHRAPDTSFRLLVEYDGARYSGWQRQGRAQQEAGVRTVAGAIGRVLHKAGVRMSDMKGAGRTDAGVHALGQVAHLRLEEPTKAGELYRILEQGLPYDIAVTEVAPCPAGFDARRDAVSRTYLYQVALRKSAFSKSHTWWPKLPLDMGLIEALWPLFEGNRSMAAFADLEEGEDPNCQIYACRAEAGDHLLLLRVTARFFLRRQVRRMVGAAVNCATGRADAARLRRCRAGPSIDADPDAAQAWAELAAPASGLFLESVKY